MSTAISTRKESAVTAFQWRDRTGQLHLIKRMETRHLFYTLRMIWNHTMPASARLPGNLYSLGPTYTRDYMLKAIEAIVPELATRNDMTKDWVRQLQKMIDWLSKHQLDRSDAARAAIAAAT